jgi:hypothetical protein
MRQPVLIIGYSLLQRVQKYKNIVYFTIVNLLIAPPGSILSVSRFQFPDRFLGSFAKTMHLSHVFVHWSKNIFWIGIHY